MSDSGACPRRSSPYEFSTKLSSILLVSGFSIPHVGGERGILQVPLAREP